MKKLLLGVTLFSLSALWGCGNETLTIRITGTIKGKEVISSGCVLKIEVSKDIELVVRTNSSEKCSLEVGTLIHIKKDL